MKKNLSPEILFELYNLFNKKQWKIDVKNDVKTSLFNRYCSRLKLLNPIEQSFYLELSYRFEQIGVSEYLENFLMSFFCIEEQKLISCSKIIIAPLSNPFINTTKKKGQVERPKTKSSQFLYYLLSAEDLRWLDYSSKFEFCETFSEISYNFVANKTLLLLIDDFIGTGGTAIKCCNALVSEISKTKKISNNDISIVAIGSLDFGIRNIKNQINIDSYSNIIRNKGITNFYGNDVGEKKNLMVEIEKKLSCPVKYSLGYKKSEALISFMKKTPNNTFPAFWHETKSKIAPFPRYKTFK